MVGQRPRNGSGHETPSRERCVSCAAEVRRSEQTRLIVSERRRTRRLQARNAASGASNGKRNRAPQHGARLAPSASLSERSEQLTRARGGVLPTTSNDNSGFSD